MKTIKSIGHLGVALVVLTGAAEAEGGSWWAVAEGNNPYGPTDTYGAAWNYANLPEAEAAAIAECQKHTDKGCHMGRTGRDSCFIVTRNDGHHKGSGPYTSFSVFGPHPSRAEAEAEVQRYIAEDIAYLNSDSSQHTSFLRTMELVECSGVDNVAN